ncbi:MAG: T9SS type A sorting domain-containing protein [Ignavibacteriae bacterium]|nr:T9SS type A sorting domain-containing protein [Ignavibacteriota bacterium]
MHKITQGFFFRALILATLAGFSLGFAKDPDNPAGRKEKNQLYKGAGTPRYAVLNINNLHSWHRSDGLANHSPASDNGLYYPRFTSWAIYQDGILWGGKVYTDAAYTTPGPYSQLIRVGGAHYGTGTVEGWVTGTGAGATAVSPSDAAARMYRIRRDYYTLKDPETLAYTEELRRDAAEVNEISTPEVSDADMEAVFAQYETDWNAWPVQYGAPYIDRNGNGVYDPPPAFTIGDPDDETDNFTVDSLIVQGRDEPGVSGSDPNSPADQVLWTVYNDLNRTQTATPRGSEPFGVEIQKTVWGYKRTDALGNLYFTRLKIINKGGVDIDGSGTKGSLYVDSMYVTQWSDPDLGNAGDDLLGTDTVLSLGYVYNGNAIDQEYAKYSLAPPSSGYDFLAGPIVSSLGDTAVFDLKYRGDYRNLPMTGFSYFSAGSPYSDPPGNYSQGVIRWYKMMRGFAPLDGPDEPYAFPPEVTDPIAQKFPLSGDPVAGTGWLDGLGEDWSFAQGDRRLLLNTGPFNLDPGDTQEVTTGTVVGLGSDRISSVAVLKFNDRFAQNTFDALFAVPKSPLEPDVKVAELDGKVVLEWGSNTTRVTDIEDRVNQPGQYEFEGYNIYQLPSRGSTLADAHRITTFDLPTDPAVVLDEQFDLASGLVLFKPVQFGRNSGVQRTFVFDRDYIRDINALYNGQEYYLAVTAYAVAKQAGFLPAQLESSPTVYTVRPQVPFGKELNTEFGVIAVADHAGPSDGTLNAVVINPAAVTGDTYQVGFSGTGAGKTWSLTNTTTSQVLLSGQTNENADALSPIAEGIQWKVGGAPNDLKDAQHVAGPSGPIDPPSYASFGFQGFPTTLPGNPDRPIADWGGGAWGFNQGGGADGSYATFVARSFRNDNFTRFVPYDFEIRFTAAGGRAFMAYSTGAVVDVPFELWNIGVGTPNDASDDYRMIPWIFDELGDDLYNLTGSDHPSSGGDNDPYLDWIYFREPTDKTPGSAGYNVFVAAGAGYDGSQGTGGEVIARLVLVNFNGGSVSDPSYPANLNALIPATGNVIRIISTKPNSVSDVFTVNTDSLAPTTGAAVEKQSAENIGVFPNPYYGFNPAETSRFSRFVTFNHLPRKATIRIFNLAGQLVRTIDKDDTSQFMRWNLLNQYNFPVASGMYVAHIDMPDLGVSKVLKLAIIQEQEVLDVY